jgi:hypothetical protein
VSGGEDGVIKVTYQLPNIFSRQLHHFPEAFQLFQLKAIS